MNITFATYAATKDDLLNNYLLANSIHDFAGNLSDIPLHIYLSSDLSVYNEMDKFAGLNVKFSEYPAPKKGIDYAFKSAAAHACEAEVKTGNVIWMDRHMLVLGPCANLLLNPLEQFAYCPPHLKLLGASTDAPINQMWMTAYKITGVDTSVLFPIYTEVDRKQIWSYFSAGHFSFRAEAGLMREWDTVLNQLAEHDDMRLFLDDDTLAVYGATVRIFLHQIALTLTVLKRLSRNELKPLPLFYGYPIHLHNEIEKYYQVGQMDQLHTAFYSGYDGIIPNMPLSKQLTFWLEEKVSLFQGK